MAKSEPNSGPQLPTLPYGNRPLTYNRTSRAAVASFFLSAFCSPCVLYPFIDTIIVAVAKATSMRNRSAAMTFLFVMLLATLSVTLLSINAIVRMGRSGGTLEGRGLALAALIINFPWWVILALIGTSLFVK